MSLDELPKPDYIIKKCVQCDLKLDHPLMCMHCNRRFSLPALSSPFYYLGMPVVAYVKHQTLQQCYQHTLSLLHPCKFSRYTQQWRRKQEALVQKSASRLHTHYGWLSAYYEELLLLYKSNHQYVSISNRVQRIQHIDHEFTRPPDFESPEMYWVDPWHELADVDAHRDQAHLWNMMVLNMQTMADKLSQRLVHIQPEMLSDQFCANIEKELQKLKKVELQVKRRKVHCQSRWNLV